MIGYVYFSALRDLARPGRLLVWLIGITLFGIVCSYAARNIQGMSPREIYGTLSTIILFRLVALASATFAVSVIGQEVEQKTIVYLVTRPVDRRILILGRALASITMVFLLTTVAILIFRVLVLGAGSGLFAGLPAELWSVLLGAFAYGGIFTFITLLANKATVICLLYAFGFETFSAFAPGSMAYLSVQAHMAGIAQHPAAKSGGILGRASGQMASTIKPLTANLVLLCLGAVMLAAAAVWFATFEYLPREDAE